MFSDSTYCQADLAQPGCERRVVRWCDEQGIDTLDLLVHNAGTGYWGATEDQTSEDIARVVAVNLSAPIALTHGLFDRLSAAGGHVVFVGSVIAALPCPDYAVYGATKAGLDGLARNLVYELAPQVTTQVIHPGATRTGFHEKIGVSSQALDPWRFPTAESVAARIERKIGKRRRAMIGLGNRTAWSLGRRLPSVMDALIKPRTTPGTSLLPRPEGRRHAVVTGGADGIGRALVTTLVSRGTAVTGVDVDQERSEATRESLTGKEAPVSFLSADLSDPHDRAGVVAKLCTQEPIDLLVHNAGINIVGRLQNLDLDGMLKVVQVNLLAPMEMMAHLLASGHIREGGTIVFVSSLSHFVGYPAASVYAATKDALASYSRSLRVALRNRGVNVLTVFPGPTRTEHARRYSPDNSRERSRMLPEDLADRILKAVERRRRILIPGWTNRQAARLGFWLPAITERAMARAILDLGET